MKNTILPKVLAIDDEAICLEIIEFSLLSKGFDVISARSGMEALSFLKNNDDIDVILLDMMMPQMSGLETLELIRAIDSASSIPIIFQTGSSYNAEINKAQDEGKINYIIRKPYKRDELIQVISTAFANK